MSKNEKKLLPIDYTHREFESIQQDLLEIAERFYPDSFQDFSEASFGALMLDAVSYVGDQLSFYLDYNVNESFLDTSFQYSNVVRHGAIMGYKFGGRPSTYGSVALFLLVPATSMGLGPDTSYMPILKRGSTLSSDTGLSFVLTENIDFASPKNTFVAGFIGSPKMNLFSGSEAEKLGAHTIGIRPEHFTIEKDSGLWEGKVGVTERLGSDTFVHLHCAHFEQAITVRADSALSVEYGEKLYITPDTDQLHKFDANGLRSHGQT